MRFECIKLNVEGRDIDPNEGEEETDGEESEFWFPISFPVPEEPAARWDHANAEDGACEEAGSEGEESEDADGPWEADFSVGEEAVEEDGVDGATCVCQYENQARQGLSETYQSLRHWLLVRLRGRASSRTIVGALIRTVRRGSPSRGQRQRLSW